MRISFNLLGCGLGNNGGSQTLIKSCETLNELGVKSDLVSDIDNFTWFKHRKCINFIPENTSAVIATGCGTVERTSKLKVAKKYWWIRAHEDWWFDDKKLLSGVMEKTIKFIDHLQNLSKKYDFFSDIRSAGLWIAADMKQATSKEFLSRSYEEGLLLVSANGESTLRFAPSKLDVPLACLFFLVECFDKI